MEGHLNIEFAYFYDIRLENISSGASPMLTGKEGLQKIICLFFPVSCNLIYWEIICLAHLSRRKVSVLVNPCDSLKL